MNPRNACRILGALLLGVTTPGLCAPLTPGASLALDGATLGTHPEWAGTVENDNLIPWQIENGDGVVILRGELQNRVIISNTTAHVVISPRLVNLESPSGAGRIVRYLAEGFAGVGVDADFRLDGSGELGPATVTRSAEPGASIAFDYSTSPLGPPDTGRFMVMGVDTPAFALTGSATIFAEESPGGEIFSVQIPGTAKPIVQQRLNLRSLTRDSEEGLLTLVWDASPGTDYELQRSTNGQSWFSFQSVLATSSTGFHTFAPSAGAAQFYRVVIP